MVDHGLGQHIDHLVAVDPPPDMDRQALPRVLVDQVQEPHCPSIVGVGTHEVVGPDVIAMLRPQPRAGAVVEPQTSAWFLPLRHLQSFAMPYELHAILARIPPSLLQLAGDASISIPAILAGQCDDGPGQRVLVIPQRGLVALGAAWLVNHWHA